MSGHFASSSIWSKGDMDLLAGYGSDSGDEQSTTVSLPMSINAAPEVLDMGTQLSYANPRYEESLLPVTGPVNPADAFRRTIKEGYQFNSKHVPTGYVEDFTMAGHSFDEQFRAFQSAGWQKSQEFKAQFKNLTEEARKAQEEKLAEYRAKFAKADAASQPTTADGTPVVVEKKAQQGENKSYFYGKEEKDYLGRSWVEPPSDLRPKEDPENFLPKAEIGTWSGHPKGVSAIRFFPTYGHLLLSGGMDNKVKIWDANGGYGCKRSYIGHTRAVRDVQFTSDGRKFLSASFDRHVKEWDTETGQCLGVYTNQKIPYCVKYHPTENEQFIAGTADKKLIQWDTRTPEKIVQEYDQHLGAVNSVTFIDDNRRFVSSSDDKSLRIWEWGIPVVIKLISEPHMHSMPAVTTHPNGKWFAAQSLDNQILIYGQQERFKLNRKKRFTGHNVAGFACQPSFSPDGQYLTSGDSGGRVFFWEWKTSRILKTLKCHEKVCIDVEWHPIHTSKMATCSWDGTIKYWD